jgi:hypothetical protein
VSTTTERASRASRPRQTAPGADPVDVAIASDTPFSERGRTFADDRLWSAIVERLKSALEQQH